MKLKTFLKSNPEFKLILTRLLSEEWKNAIFEDDKKISEKKEKYDEVHNMLLSLVEGV